MKKALSGGKAGAWCAAIAIVFFIPIACERQNEISSSRADSLSTNVACIKTWWENRKINEVISSPELISRIPDSVSIQSYRTAQFQNGIPKWADAKVYTVNGETIYQVPFRFPDNLVMMNDKPDAPPQLYVTGKAGTNEAMKPYQTYLIVKERTGMPNVAEIMCVVLNNPYIEMLDSAGIPYPNVAITNVYPGSSSMGDFCGSVKFYDLNGVQLIINNTSLHYKALD